MISAHDLQTEINHRQKQIKRLKKLITRYEQDIEPTDDYIDIVLFRTERTKDAAIIKKACQEKESIKGWT